VKHTAATRRWRPAGRGLRPAPCTVALLLCATPCLAQQPAPADNSVCVVCHLDLAAEELVAKHIPAGVGCATCHGESPRHVDDEMGTTRPDLLYGRAQVDAFCLPCHPQHKDPAKVTAFRAEWRDRVRPNGRRILDSSPCTDCHGAHVLLRPGAKQQAAWVDLFNGRDLTGWRQEGGASWTVEDGVLVGQQNAGQPGDLYTERDYADFELEVTFKMVWPGNSGIWFRKPANASGYQFDILDLREYGCTVGTIYSDGFLAQNTDESIVHLNDWNDAYIRCQGDRIQATLNGFPVADLHDTKYSSGAIGFQVHPGEQYAPMRIMVRKARLRTVAAQ